MNFEGAMSKNKVYYKTQIVVYNIKPILLSNHSRKGHKYWKIGKKTFFMQF